MADVKKLKIDGTNYDVKIPSENVKLMTGYSKGSSTNAITPSDSLNSAIGKLECRADKNQDNVLYALNTGVKNALVVNDREESGSGTIKFSAKNGVVTVTGTAGSSTSFFSFNFTGISGRFKLNGCPSGGSDNTYLQRIYTADGSLAIAIDRGSGTAEFTLDPNVSYQWTIRIQANYAIQNSLVFKPMLYQADTDGSTFQTGALPNSDLTRLEAEDRASLAEVVDSGAKNLLNISNATFGDRSKVTFNSDGSVTGAITDDARYWSWANSEFKFTLPAGSYVLYCVVTSGTNANWGIALRKSDNSEVAVVNSYTGKDVVEFTLTSATEVGFMGKIFDRILYPMLCTKAAFDVSQKFVPYRMNYDKLIDFATAKSVSTADFIEFATGYSNVAQTNIYRQGNHIFGRIICQKTSGNFSSSQQTIATIKSAYRPTENQIGQSYYNSSAQWGIEAIGYSYLSSDGTVIVKTYSDGDDKYNYCTFLVDFLIKT